MAYRARLWPAHVWAGLSDTRRRVEVLLEEWALADRLPPEISALAAPNRASGGLASTGASDLEQMSDAAAGRRAEDMDAVLNFLGQMSPAQRAAIDYQYGQTALIRFPRDNFGVLIERAKEESIPRIIRSRSIWRYLMD